ncbi:rRNA-binding ribosome biosynthesis protein utp25 [Malassezia caprae]|uniref:U3 small nucleolar RNA-associated protein 25 n=1 Tax=Malassezia caprae TaxID=1381934 RepID=A0AAF0E4J6_9BASI|nr:rRNA-binding ribosome biosynthesis protein utp25 [Malassezia caprae]
MGSDNQAHVRLLTLLNVHAAHPRSEDDMDTTSAKRKRVSSVAPRAAPAAQRPKPTEAPATAAPAEGEPDEVLVAADDEDDDSEDTDAFRWHFGAESEALAAVDPDSLQWSSPVHVPALGGAIVTNVQKKREGATRPVSRPHARIWSAFQTQRKRGLGPRQAELLPLLGQYKDVWHSRVPMDEHEELRQITAMHALSHVTKTRQRILKDNEKLAKAAAAQAEDDANEDEDEELPELRDQGFTRPKVLLLAPFRHTAKLWVQYLMTLSACEQVEQKSRFFGEFSLPPGAIDKLADPAMASKYPEDHRRTFQGNIDDNFKLGIKLTRKTLKLYSPFFDSDVIVASPLGLRLLIEKEKNADYLSSIEVLLIDQGDVMLMQNWDHVKFVVERLNAIPKEAHDTDFSRVKPWYLDGHAPLLRQSVLFTSFDAPEFRHLFHTFRNVGGRVRTSSLPADHVPAMSLITPGVRQTFYKFDCSNAQGEADQRLQAFQQKIWPLLRKSAVSATHTMIVIPSYFDFVRVEDMLRRMDPPVSYTTLSEYSTNRDISRAREAFFTGKKSFLLVTERFHFYRRYLIRGAVTIVFYAPPEHAAYYPEFIHAPLSSRDASAAPVDAADLQVFVLYGKYDLLRLERIAGPSQARSMVTDGRPLWRFV